MKTSETIEKLCADYVKAQAELKNAVFDKVNPHFKSRYATLSAVRDTVTPILTKNNLAVIQGTAQERDGYIITTRLLHSSGQWIESAYPFAIAKPQEMGSAMTYARRYCLAAICGIASEEDDDANAASAEDKKPKLQTVNGEPAQPKAKSREPFDAIAKGINQIESNGTLEDLTRWYQTHVKTIETFPADWHEQIMEKFTEAKETIKGKAA